MGQIRIVWNDAAIKLSTSSASGPIGRAMRQLADQTVLEMKRRTPVYTGPPRTGPTTGHPLQGPARRSGTLRSSVRSFRQADGSFLIGPVDQVAPGVFLGALVERGTRSHVIRSHGAWPLYSTATRRRYGRPVYARRDPAGRLRDSAGRFTRGPEGALLYWEVHHPGTRPHPFVRPGAEAMNGRRVVARLEREGQSWSTPRPPSAPG